MQFLFSLRMTVCLINKTTWSLKRENNGCFKTGRMESQVQTGHFALIFPMAQGDTSLQVGVSMGRSRWIIINKADEYGISSKINNYHKFLISYNTK